VRTIATVPITPEQAGFPHAAQIVRLERRTRSQRGAKPSREVVWLVTSLTPEQASPRELLRWIRQYWRIEGGEHQRLDASLAEDACRVRHPKASWTLAILRRFVLGEYHPWARRQNKRRDRDLSCYFNENQMHPSALINTLVLKR